MDEDLLKSSIWYENKNYTVYYTNGEPFVNYSDAEEYCKKLPELKMFIHDSDMVCTHNIPCMVCKTNHAVFVSSGGYCEPCWECQSNGWKLTKGKPESDKPWWRKLF